MSIELNLEVGREKLNFNTGYLAKQADGAVAVSYGEVVVFASVGHVAGAEGGAGFLPPHG